MIFCFLLSECVQSQGGFWVLHSYGLRTKPVFWNADLWQCRTGGDNDEDTDDDNENDDDDDDNENEDRILHLDFSSQSSLSWLNHNHPGDSPIKRFCLQLLPLPMLSSVHWGANDFCWPNIENYCKTNILWILFPHINFFGKISMFLDSSSTRQHHWLCQPVLDLHQAQVSSPSDFSVDVAIVVVVVVEVFFLLMLLLLLF